MVYTIDHFRGVAYAYEYFLHLKLLIEITTTFLWTRLQLSVKTFEIIRNNATSHSPWKQWQKHKSVNIVRMGIYKMNPQELNVLIASYRHTNVRDIQNVHKHKLLCVW